MSGQNLYYINFMKSASYNFTADDSVLIGKLTSLGQKINQEANVNSFAQEILNAFYTHQFFAGVDRICIARLIYPTNELMSISSANKNINPNWSYSYYRCFVDPEGSLFNIQPNIMRIYDSIDIIAEDYATKQKPPQRAFQYIYKSGLKSGLCLSLFNGNKAYGYIFLNSVQPSFFANLRKEDYGLLSLVQLIASNFLLQTTKECHLPMIDHEHIENGFSKSRVFEPNELSRVLEESIRTFFDLHISIKIESSIAEPFIYSPYLFILTISSMINYFFANRRYLYINFYSKENMGVFRIEIAHSTQDSPISSMLEEVFSQEVDNFGYKFYTDNYFYYVEFPIDKTFKGNKNILYSV